MGIKMWVKPYVSADASPDIEIELQGEDKLVDSQRLADPKVRQALIKEWLNRLWKKGDKKMPSGRSEWLPYAGLRVTRIPKQEISEKEKKRIKEIKIMKQVDRDIAPMIEDIEKVEKTEITRVKIVSKARPYQDWEVQAIRKRVKAKILAEQTGRTPQAIWQKRYRLRKKGII